ncbi:MAG: hypothetical protein AABY40_02275 [Nanoarchaeota archaeon]
MRNPKCQAKRMAELAPGLVAVYDASDEIDTYFDSSRWTESSPDFLGDSLFVADDQSIGVLQGVGCLPPVDSFKKALWFAGYSLKSTYWDAMNMRPKEINLDEVLVRYISVN